MKIVVAHIVHRFSVGGLENGVINLVNTLPADMFQHIIVSLTDLTEIIKRLENDDVQCIGLGKKEGLDPRTYARLFALLREIKPHIVHTRNLGTLDCQVCAAMAGVPCRIHGEHGRGMRNLDGGRMKDVYIRRMIGPLVHKYVALSRDIEKWLLDTIGIPGKKIVQIYNGVDTDRFSPVTVRKDAILSGRRHIRVGTVGRLQEEKDQATLLKAFALLVEGGGRTDLRLDIVGGGPLRAELERLARSLGIEEFVVFHGEQEDIPEFMRTFDIFVLPSLIEGISNTILEAMATSLPVVATDVGGNPELVIPGVTGFLVPRRCPEEMARTIKQYADDVMLRVDHGAAGRTRALEEFSIARMTRQYEKLYMTAAVDAGVCAG